MCSWNNDCICTITIINKYNMKNNYNISIKFCYNILFSIVLSLLISCNGLTGIPQSNILPETHIFLDSIDVQQNSQVYLSWQGDDSDGLIIGYIISWNGKDWFYTQKNDSVFSLKVETSDTNYTFRVSAIDNSLSLYPKEGDIIAFSDMNNNGIHDENEPFPSLSSSVDLSPASLKVPIKNTAPLIAWGIDTNAKSAIAVALPDTTFTFATFQYFVSDLDGIETIASVEWSLNDSSSSATWHTIPLNSKLFNIKESDGLKINADNRIYLRATDIGKLKSKILQYPFEGKVWYVKKPMGSILLIKDSGSPDADAFYTNALQNIAGGKFSSGYDVLDIYSSKTVNSQAKTLPPFISPMFIETLRLFKTVIWYSDKSPSVELAQQSLPEYIRTNGKVIFITEFPVPLTLDYRTALLDFAPIDSISQKEVSDDPLAIRNGTEIKPIKIGAWEYPILIKEKGSVLVYNLYPKVTANPLYILPENPKWLGTPILGILGENRQMIFMHMPLHLVNKNGGAMQFLDIALTKEFAL